MYFLFLFRFICSYFYQKDKNAEYQIDKEKGKRRKLTEIQMADFINQNHLNTTKNMTFVLYLDRKKLPKAESCGRKMLYITSFE